MRLGYSRRRRRHGSRTYFPHHLVVFQHAPRNVDAIVVPIGPGHVLVDIRVHTGDAGRSHWAALARVGSVAEALDTDEGRRATLRLTLITTDYVPGDVGAEMYTDVSGGCWAEVW